MSETYVEVLQGAVALPDYMQGNFLNFAARLKQHIQEEQHKINPDNGLIALLCDAARVGWEHLESVKVRNVPERAIKVQLHLALGALRFYSDETNWDEGERARQVIELVEGGTDGET